MKQECIYYPVPFQEIFFSKWSAVSIIKKKKFDQSRIFYVDFFIHYRLHIENCIYDKNHHSLIFKTNIDNTVQSRLFSSF